MFCTRILRALLRSLLKRNFKACGDNFVFDPLRSEFSYEHIIIGSNVFIAPKAWFRATHGNIVIGSHVMFGPGVSILSGNHRYDTIGIPMINLKKDSEWKDKDIIIEDDVWIGANVTILSGVTIGRGAIVGAGSVVTKDIETYSISAGVPAAHIKYRFNKDEIKKHESILYKQ